jgi:hypothetical protein
MVKVQGDAGVLGRLRPDSIQAYVRLPEGFNNGGSCTVDVTAPRDVAVKEIVPDRVSLLRTNLNN